jgi:AcrR family transcriptional regulator
MTQAESFKQKRHDATTEILVHAAEEVMTRKGFEAVTMREIAAEAGCSPATLYQYFPGKEDLLTAIFERHSKIIVEKIRAGAAEIADPLERLKNNIRTSIEYASEHKAVGRLLRAGVSRKSGDLLEAMPEAARAHWVDLHRDEMAIIREAQKQGRMRADFPPDLLHWFIRLLCSGVFEQFGFQEQSPSLEEQFRILWGLLSDGMGMRDGVK